MKQADTKKLVLGCLVIMILMILYTKVTTGIEQDKQEAEVAAEYSNSILMSDYLTGFSDATGEDAETGEAGSGKSPSAEASVQSENGDEEDILGPAEKMDLDKAKKEPYGLVAELDYVSAGRISLHGSFGYMAVSLTEAEDGTAMATIENAVTLEELGGIKMGGAAYTDVLGGDGCVLIVPGIHNKEIARRRKFLYIEETNEITGGIMSPDWMMKKMADYDYSDAVVIEELIEELKQALNQSQSGDSKLLYGPVVIPEYNSNTYGFLAESGENLEHLWYGQWNRDIGTIVRIPLFREE